MVCVWDSPIRAMGCCYCPRAHLPFCTSASAWAGRPRAPHGDRASWARVPARHAAPACVYVGGGMDGWG